LKINHIGVSGGKDSTALLLWAVHESGYPLESLRVSFCDTGNENQITYDYVKMLSEKVHPIEWLKPELGFYELAHKKKRFPSRKARFCTQHLKMLPTQRHVWKMVEEGHEVLLHSGVRAAESADRAKLPEREWDGFFALPVFRPLLKWSIAEVWEMHRKYGIPPNPLYAQGFKRCGCFPCINSCKEEVRLIAKHFPERIEKLSQEEKSFDTRNGISTFFVPKTVPEGQRSKEIVTAKGAAMKVATIEDVVRWSRTERGGKQYVMDLESEPDLAGDDYLSCPSALGVCE
jgi:3'-phosphoadenosine 5'-phosphosulfate sulfotransferase (PAPS reductase)/FAD synthetase